MMFPSTRQMREAAEGWRVRRVFAWLPIRCDDGKYRWLDTVRVQECRLGRGWYRVGATTVVLP